MLELLHKGGSPLGACQQLGLSLLAFSRTQAECQEFRLRLIELHWTLSQNVAAAMYQAAMRGSVAAQSYWLRALPPPVWQEAASANPQPVTFDEIFDGLSDHELVQLAKALGVDLPFETEADPAQPPARNDAE